MMPPPSSVALAERLGISQKSAWYLGHRIRRVWKLDTASLFNGTVEADETYMGGIDRNRHYDKKGTVKKTPVVGMKERDSNRVTATVMLNVNKFDVQHWLHRRVSAGSRLFSGEAAVYVGSDVGEAYCLSRFLFSEQALLPSVNKSHLQYLDFRYGNALIPDRVVRMQASCYTYELYNISIYEPPTTIANKVDNLIAIVVMLNINTELEPVVPLYDLLNLPAVVETLTVIQVVVPEQVSPIYRPAPCLDLFPSWLHSRQYISLQSVGRKLIFILPLLFVENKMTVVAAVDAERFHILDGLYV